MTGKDEDNGYPRILDAKGCIFGQRVQERLGDMDKKVERIEKRLGKLTGAAVAAALSFTVSGVLLALNLLFR